jgi:hypothetical protein
MASRMKKIDQNSNSAIDHIISIGINESKSDLDQSTISVYFSEVQEKKIEEYCRVFGLSVRTMLNSCVQYTIFFAEKNKSNVSDLKYFPKRLGSRCHKLTLNAETLAKIKDNNVSELDEITKYVIVGINLLYEKNINIKVKNKK